MNIDPSQVRNHSSKLTARLRLDGASSEKIIGRTNKPEDLKDPNYLPDRTQGRRCSSVPIDDMWGSIIWAVESAGKHCGRIGQSPDFALTFFIRGSDGFDVRTSVFGRIDGGCCWGRFATR